MKIKSTISILFVFLTSNFSVAAEPAGSEKCRQEAEKHCPDLTGRDLLQCMRSKKDEFSKDCQPSQDDMKKNRKVFFACQEEIKTFCKDVAPGGGRIIECLKENTPHLSESCKESMK